MSDKKETSTALVPTTLIEPIDAFLVPYLGYEDIQDAEQTRKKEATALIKSSVFTAASIGTIIIGTLLTGAVSATAPYIFFAPIFLAFGCVGFSWGFFLSFINFHRLIRANNVYALASRNDKQLALAEGGALAQIKAVNERAEKWNEGWEILIQEEANLFAMHEKCISKKSKRGLIKRIEYIRKEKKKHLKVRLRIEQKRERILAGIEAMEKLQEHSTEQRLLEAGEE